MTTRIAVLVVWSVLVASPAAAQRPSQAVPRADVNVTTAVTLVRAGNANRATLNCTNNDATNAVRWGGSTSTTATTGQRIPAGATITVAGPYPVYMIAESTTVAMSCTEEEN